MTKLRQFGEDVDGYQEPVLNEREIRAAAGILFVFVFTALMFILFRQDFRLIKYVITFFLTDFAIRVLVSPRLAPTLILGRLIVARQTPEYVSAAPKEVAWMLGLLLSATMFVLMVVVNSYSIITGLICLVCLLFLFFESAFGICLGCLLYRWHPNGRRARCPGDVCAAMPRHPIQKTSAVQLLALVAFFAYAGMTVILFGDGFAAQPHPLFRVSSSSPR